MRALPTLRVFIGGVLSLGTSSCGPRTAVPELPLVRIEVRLDGGSKQRFERGVWLRGESSLRLAVKGSGLVAVTAREELGEAAELLKLECAGGSKAEEVVLPGRGVRPLALEFHLDGELEWADLEVMTGGPEPAPDPARESRPLAGSLRGRDVVLIVADSLNAAHLSCYGSDKPVSPTLDQLALRGVRFEAAYSQTSWTLPSVTSLLTSLEQERHGVLEVGDVLDDEIQVLPELFRAAGYRTQALIQNGVVHPRSRIDRGFDSFTSYRRSQKTDELLLDASEALREERDQPLFLYLHLLSPHQPYRAPERFTKLFVDPDYEGPITGSVDDSARLNAFPLSADSADVRQLSALYDASIRHVDQQLKSFLTGLASSDEPCRPLLVFTSDHGEAFLQHGMQGHNTQVYEEMLRVPLILFAPDVLPCGQVVDSPASLLDILPTLAELCGLESDADALSGRSLVGPIEAPGSRLDRPLYFSSRHRSDPERLRLAVRQGNYKLVRNSAGQKLFDLSADPGELRNLSKAQPVHTLALSTMLDDWYSEVTSGVKTARKASVSEQAMREMATLGYVGEDAR